jgi:hypothetical protein
LSLEASKWRIVETPLFNSRARISDGSVRRFFIGRRKIRAENSARYRASEQSSGNDDTNGGNRAASAMVFAFGQLPFSTAFPLPLSFPFFSAPGGCAHARRR